MNGFQLALSLVLVGWPVLMATVTEEGGQQGCRTGPYCQRELGASAKGIGVIPSLPTNASEGSVLDHLRCNERNQTT